VTRAKDSRLQLDWLVRRDRKASPRNVQTLVTVSHRIEYWFHRRLTNDAAMRYLTHCMCSACQRSRAEYTFAELQWMHDDLVASRRPRSALRPGILCASIGSCSYSCRSIRQAPVPQVICASRQCTGARRAGARSGQSATSLDRSARGAMNVERRTRCERGEYEHERPETPSGCSSNRSSAKPRARISTA
jgi:hypothetical protein